MYQIESSTHFATVPFQLYIENAIIKNKRNLNISVLNGESSEKYSIDSEANKNEDK